MKTYYPIQIFDSRLPVAYLNPMKIRLLDEYDENQTNTNLYVILLKHRKTKMVSEGKTVVELKLFEG